MSNKGYIYVLTNPAMPGLVKIGRSINGGRKRAAELYQTGVPSPFRIEFEMLFDDAVEAEKRVHNELSSDRYSQSREFFSVDAGEATFAVVNTWVTLNGGFIADYDTMRAAAEVTILAKNTGTSWLSLTRILRKIPKNVIASLLIDNPPTVKQDNIRKLRESL